MSAPARLIAFAAVLATVFGLSALAGAALGPEPKVHDMDAGGELQLRLENGALSFAVTDEDGAIVRDFDLAHERRMHVIVVRHDLTGFQHLHPAMDTSGTWTTPIELPEPGDYRVFADFERDGERSTLSDDVTVDGRAAHAELPAPAERASTSDGYEVAISESDGTVAFTITRDGAPVAVEPYLGAGGHLVVLREGDLEFLHVHPTGADPEFEVEFPTDGRYRLFLQFRHEGRVHTAALTQEVATA